MTTKDLGMTDALQTHFLQLAENKPSTSIYLANGIKLQGKIVAQDSQTVALEGTGGNVQLVYKNAISTVVPVDCRVDSLMAALQ